MEMSEIKTKKAIVELALQEYINMKRRQDLIALFGNVNWDGDLNQMRTDTTPNEWDQ